MRKLFLLAILSALPASAVTVDRIAATIDNQVITVSEVSQVVEMRFFPRQAGQTDDDYRRAVLDALIAQALRLRDVERFGAADVSLDEIEARLAEIRGRFSSAAEFEAALVRAELSLDELRALVRRQLQVDAYIEERFALMIFVSNEEIAAYPDQGLPREEIRTRLRRARLGEEVERWTSRLRLRANVDVYAWR
jgi:hypothetical protein